MSFRDRLISTLRAVRPVLDVEGVLVVGSEVPNLLQPEAASTLVISQDVDIGVPVARHGDVKRRLRDVEGLHPSAEEPSVWIPIDPGLIEVNLIGIDPTISDAAESYVLEDDEMPLLVFGYLSLLSPGPVLRIEGLAIPLPRVAGLLVEKLLTERSGEKGDRDLLVALGLMLVAAREDLEELVALYVELDVELRHALRSNLTILSLLRPHEGMPDPSQGRERVASLLRRLDHEESDK